MREVRPEEAIDEQGAPIEASIDERALGGGGFTARGAIPPIGAPPIEQAPSASDRAYDAPLYDKQTTAPPTAEQARSGFDKVAHGGLKSKDAPATIALPKPARDGLQQAWDESHGGTDQAQEHGGNLVRDKHDQYKWEPTKAGKNDTIIPDDEVGKGEKLVGFGHTHPYESGKEDVSFSAEDISSIVDESQPVDLLQSGKTLFVIARTAEFDAMIKDLDDDQAAALRTKIETSWKAVFDKAEGTFQQKVEAAVAHTCHEFKLLYYRGDGTSLNRVP